MDRLTGAASAFNVLLEKYRHHNGTLTSPTPSLSLSNPNMIYIIFTVAIAHLSGYRTRHPQSGMQKTGTAMSLQTQAHLLNCLEALTSIGVTWGLARRCWKTLDRLMEAEGLKPQRNAAPSDAAQASLGKRKREEEDVIGNGRRPFLGGARGALPAGPNMEPTTLSTFAPNPVSVRSVTTPTSVPYNASGWELDPTATTPFPILAPSLHSELFGSTDFPSPSSAKWLPEAQENESIGLGIVWNGEWDDQLWARTIEQYRVEHQ